MLQSGSKLNLALEPLGTERGGQLGVEHLECDWTLVLDVAGQIDRGHAPTTKLALEHVAVAQGSSQRGGQVGERRWRRDVRNLTWLTRRRQPGSVVRVGSQTP
jgi:hypothetical protein